LPASSVQVPGTDASPVSGPEYVTVAHDRIPDSWSLPLKATSTGWRYQPFVSGPRAAWAPVAAGDVESYFSPNWRLAELPALSVQVAVKDAVAESGPAYARDGQDAIPDVPSVPWTSNVTARLNQPAELAARSGTAADTAGSVSSYFSPYGNGELTLPALSRHVPDTFAAPLSGPLYVRDVQVSIPDVWSTPLNVIPTGLVYQPFVPAARAGVPAVVSGGVWSTFILS